MNKFLLPSRPRLSPPSPTLPSPLRGLGKWGYLKEKMAAAWQKSVAKTEATAGPSDGPIRLLASTLAPAGSLPGWGPGG